jgi:AcrR family transcriptional regulator
MSAIASELGGSKSTLWKYFPSKQELFIAVIDDMTAGYVENLLPNLPERGDPADTLHLLGCAIVSALDAPGVIGLHRLVLAEAEQFPELGRLLWDRGARRGHQLVSAWMAAQMNAGLLRHADADVAARHFIALCQSGVFQRRLLGITPQLQKATVSAEIARAVEVFVLAYGVAA